MVSYTVAFMLALALALVLTPISRRIALRVGAVSKVGGRNVNVIEMPRLGGVAIALSAVVPLVALFFVESEVARRVRLDEPRVVALLVGASVMCAVGAWDDVRGLSAKIKLPVQIACAVLAYELGFQIPSITAPGFGSFSLGPLAFPVTVLWIVGVTNAVNLIDGLDGLAAGVIFCAATTNLVVAAIGGSVLVAVVMASVMGALFGFLFYNFNPARIFMGDSGSYFAGFVLSTVSLAGNQKASTAVSLLVPILALGLPIFDTLLSLFRRAITRRPLLSADRGHIHHKLLDLGLTHRRAVLSLYGFSILFALAGVAVALDRDWTTGAALLLATVLIAGLLRISSSVSQQLRTLPPGEFSRPSLELEAPPSDPATPSSEHPEAPRKQ